MCVQYTKPLPHDFRESKSSLPCSLVMEANEAAFRFFNLDLMSLYQYVNPKAKKNLSNLSPKKPYLKLFKNSCKLALNIDENLNTTYNLT